MSAIDTPSSNRSTVLISPHFTSIGCNRDGQCLSWDHESNLIAYGGSNLVAIYNVDDQVNAIIATMKGHTQDISTVKFFPQNCLNAYRHVVNNQQDYLITKVASGCFGGQICIFDLYQANTQQYDPHVLKTSIPPPSTLSPSSSSSFYYKLAHTIALPIQNASVLQLSLFSIGQFTILVVLTSTGGVFVYAQSIDAQSEWILIQEMYFALSQLIQISSMTLYPHPTQSIILLALGGVDGTLTLLGTTIPTVWNSQDDLSSFVSVYSANKSTTLFFSLLGSLKCHRDWIRDIAFSPTQYDQHSDALTKIYLATGSQDKTIRIISIHFPPKEVLIALSQTKIGIANPDSNDPLTTEPDGSTSSDVKSTSLLASSSLGENGHLWLIDSTPSAAPGGTLKTKSSEITPLAIATSLETVLFGHENWVMALEWYQQDEGDFLLTLLSISTDRTIIEWIQQDYTNTTTLTADTAQNASLWVPKHKIGEGLGYLCYYGGAYGPKAKRVVSISYNGALSMWNRTTFTSINDTNIPKQALVEGGTLLKPWYPIHCPTGHNKPVLDVLTCHGDDTLNINIMKTTLEKNAQNGQDGNSALDVNNSTLYGITSKHWVGPQLPYVVSISQDQTTRVYSPFVTHKSTQSGLTNGLSSHSQIQAQTSSIQTPSMLQYPWYELSRAQIHGWDLCSVTHANIDTKKFSLHHHEFVSAGEEKVLRLFRAPALFIAQLYAVASDIEWTNDDFKILLHTLITPNEHHKYLTNLSTSLDPNSIGPLPQSQLDLSTTYTRSLCAIQPKLGLSNKPMLVGDEVSTATELEANFGQDSSQSRQLTIDMLLSSLPTMKSLITPPYEEQLSTTTLWSEIDKLYGHGYDISTLSTTKSSHLLPSYPQLNMKTFNSTQILSTNHARKAKNAGVRQWALSTENLFGDEGTTEHWEEQDVLYGHQQTINCIRPSYDNNFILTVGRDMQITIFGLQHLQSTALDLVNDDTKAKIQYKPISILANAHTRQIFHCSWIFDMILTPIPSISSTDPETTISQLQKPNQRTTKSFYKYLTTCGRDKTIKIWAYNPTAAVATKSITQIQTIKATQVPTALYSIVSLPIIPGHNADLNTFLTTNQPIQQKCTNYLFVGFENGDLAIYSSTMDVTMTPVQLESASATMILPYSIELTDSTQQPFFTLHTTFDSTITHNATVNKIVAFPQVVNNSDAPQQQPIHIATTEQDIVLVSASDDHSVKIFGIKL